MVTAEVQQYRLKEGAGRHRLAPTSASELGREIKPGELFVPTEQELKAFGHKFELVTSDGRGGLTVMQDESAKMKLEELLAVTSVQTMKKMIGQELGKAKPDHRLLEHMRTRLRELQGKQVAAQEEEQQVLVQTQTATAGESASAPATTDEQKRKKK